MPYRRTLRTVVNPTDGMLYCARGGVFMVFAPLLPTSRANPVRDPQKGSERDVREVARQRHGERFEVLDLRSRRPGHELGHFVVDRDGQGRCDVHGPSSASSQRFVQRSPAHDLRPHGIGELHGPGNDRRLGQTHRRRHDDVVKLEARSGVGAAGAEQDDGARTCPLDVQGGAGRRCDKTDPDRSRDDAHVGDASLEGASEPWLESRKLGGERSGEENVRARIGLRRVGSHAHAGTPL